MRETAVARGGEKSRASWTIQSDMKDLEAVRRHFNIDNSFPIGYSYLGRMVMMYAMDHPDRVTMSCSSARCRWTLTRVPEKELTHGEEDIGAPTADAVKENEGSAVAAGGRRSRAARSAVGGDKGLLMSERSEHAMASSQIFARWKTVAANLQTAYLGMNGSRQR